MTPLQRLATTLETIGQSHALQFIDDLDEVKRERYLGRLAAIDWDLIQRLTTVDSSIRATPEWTALPAECFPLTPSDTAMGQRYAKAIEVGERELRDGRVAAFTVAGGQGSRLGWDAPKGTYPISPINEHSLFQVFAEKIRRVGMVYGNTPKWYVMTSEANHSDTVEFFEKNRFFGLSTNAVSFFPQGQLPACSTDGRLLLADKDRLAMSPDGHGGSLKALDASGAIDEMLADGFRTVSYFQVDNPLVSIVDPLFIGLHLQEESQVSSRALLKRHWSEKMGVFTKQNDTLAIVEYSDLPESAAKSVNSDGTLRFNLGSPAIHLFDVGFIRDLNTNGFSLPYHRAIKRIPYVDENGTQVAPNEPNGIKFETFVFDAIPLAYRTLILEAERHSEFAPVKNADGEDSPESCRRMMTELYASWLELRGCPVPRKADGTADCVIEISPLVARRASELDDSLIPELITPNEKVNIL